MKYGGKDRGGSLSATLTFDPEGHIQGFVNSLHNWPTIADTLHPTGGPPRSLHNQSSGHFKLH